eukprot:maker-scaffold_55-snap-gene-0.48-mRNA-1 protein AED:0.40 eAED:0.40 QI:92/1/1/1/0/0/2/118/138
MTSPFGPPPVITKYTQYRIVKGLTLFQTNEKESFYTLTFVNYLSMRDEYVSQQTLDQVIRKVNELKIDVQNLKCIKRNVLSLLPICFENLSLSKIIFCGTSQFSTQGTTPWEELVSTMMCMLKTNQEFCSFLHLVWLL